MSLYKSAQFIDVYDADDTNFLTTDEDVIEMADDEDKVILYDQEPDMEDVVELHSAEEEHDHPHDEVEEVVFVLPELPGCSEATPIEVSTDDAIEVEDEKKPEKKEKASKNDAEDVADAWDVKSAKDLVGWAQNMVNHIPKHNGQQILGIQRVVAFFDKMLRVLSKVIQTDVRGEADIEAVEKVRSEIIDAKNRLMAHEESLEKAHNKTHGKTAMTKEAQKTTAINGIVVTVPLLISTIARTAINSMVSAGKDIEHTLPLLIKKYDLNTREQAELIQLLSDMNFPIRRPRGYNLDEKIDTTSTDNFDWMQQFYS